MKNTSDYDWPFCERILFALFADKLQPMSTTARDAASISLTLPHSSHCAESATSASTTTQHGPRSRDCSPEWWERMFEVGPCRVGDC